MCRDQSLYLRIVHRTSWTLHLRRDLVRDAGRSEVVLSSYRGLRFLQEPPGHAVSGGQCVTLGRNVSAGLGPPLGTCSRSLDQPQMVTMFPPSARRHVVQKFSVWDGRPKPIGFEAGIPRQPNVFWLGWPVQLRAEVDHTSARKQDPFGGGGGANRRTLGRRAWAARQGNRSAGRLHQQAGEPRAVSQDGQRSAGVGCVLARTHLAQLHNSVLTV